MTIPETVQVGPYEYTISSNRAALLELCSTQKSTLLGYTDTVGQIIHLDERLSADMLAETLLHEVLHAVLDMTGQAYEMEGDDEERLIRRLSPALLCLLRENPELVACLCE